MDCALKISPFLVNFPKFSPISRTSSFIKRPNCRNLSNNNVIFGSCSPRQAMPNAVGDAHKHISSLESLFCYDKSVPEERIEKPTGLSLAKKNTGDNPHCPECEAKGVVLCTTCSGSGLYVDSIMESQGIIVKVRCLGCGGSGNIMCSECGGRGHLGRS
ncbi:DnaJ/Hsp40 cysteine-rich domain superfamily protein isoform 2 [Capsicum annuum]|uniref:Uncharacterized protein n=1 Tax=Capsicum annuum TaxID=4072 RepID=A0A1U8F8R2_CAPAN|nr:uncharacterized protein LOC107854580 [Capsicum annuum]KAF3627759.1 DnaJ/Hsp40 cysteine-rich domain superfamily protein isoform 2 [Capsicum annuum]PHT71261.1 hypothetical protein T459_26365 [Capsicum annuum]